MTWLISILITIGMILVVDFCLSLYTRFLEEEWAEIIIMVLGSGIVFAITVMFVHFVVFG